MSELGKRVITAIVLLGIACGWMFYLPDTWFDRATVVVGMLMSVELLVMVGVNRMPIYTIIAAFTWALLLVTWTLLPAGISVIISILFLMVLWNITFFFHTDERELSEDFRRLVYVQWMMTLLLIFVWSLMVIHRQENGIWFLAGAMAGVMSADIAAYFTGRALGMNRLCAAVSPGKTREGLYGAIIFGTAAASLIWINLAAVALIPAILLALLLVLVSAAGDLAESALKRAVGVKDSGHMLPGHGGLLDRTDAMLSAIPVVGLIWMWMYVA